ncbi:MAG TPA: hypothetical protein VMW31_05025 [Devosiaceae bacterium]|nr:hypothetical protein [Devosiaceae bacterium]
MDIVIDILLWLHFLGLAVGVGGGFALGALGPAFRGATPEQIVALAPARRRIFNAVTIALVLLVVTGPLVLWLRYGDTSGMTWWFWAKMVLVLVLIGLNVRSRQLLKAAEGGDAGAGPKLMQAGMASGVTSMLIVLAAVFAFA